MPARATDQALRPRRSSSSGRPSRITSSSDSQRLRSEAKVNRALIRELCPYKTLRRLLRQGRTLSEISDFLEVTEEFVFEAYLFYREQNPHAFRGK